MTSASKYCNVKESGKVILDPHPESDQHQHLISSRGSPLAYQVWSTSITELMSYLTDRWLNTHTHTHR